MSRCLTSCCASASGVSVLQKTDVHTDLMDFLQPHTACIEQISASIPRHLHFSVVPKLEPIIANYSKCYFSLTDYKLLLHGLVQTNQLL